MPILPADDQRRGPGAARRAEGLAAEGHEVLVIAASDRREGYSTQNAVSASNVCLPVPIRRVNQRFLLWPQRAINRLVHAFNPDIIHLHEPLLLVFPRCQSLNIPVVPCPALLGLGRLNTRRRFGKSTPTGCCGNTAVGSSASAPRHRPDR
ncbi:MAG: glycosyltransferase [Chloroflexi bacterium]|nr:glycosyltransferase [Chloroflexota bacterium]